jgi:hypothetical protein
MHIKRYLKRPDEFEHPNGRVGTIMVIKKLYLKIKQPFHIASVTNSH